MMSDTPDLENVSSLEDTPIHDQLPSVEEAHANANPNTGYKASRANRIVCYTMFGLVAGAAMLSFLGYSLYNMNQGVVDDDFYSRSYQDNNKNTQQESHQNTNTDVASPAQPVVASRIPEVIEFLLGLSAFEDLHRHHTPQYMAAKWIADEDERQVSLEDRTAFLERYAMSVFYFATNGPNWPLQLNFLSKEHICKWKQIGFGSDDKPRFVGAHCMYGMNVEQIFFPENWLTGEFPNEMNLLEKLELISIYRNPGISGPFPIAMKKLTNLKYLGLHYCDLTGSLPDWLGDLTGLEQLILSNNKLTGTIPASINKLTQLSQLFLDDNKLEGDIKLFEPLGKLENLLLEDNLITGSMDESFLKNLASLQVLDISQNQIDSTIPINLFSLANLSVVDLHENHFHGPIPNVENNNKALEFLALHDNQITGGIPNTMYMLGKLSHLDLSNNTLVGDFPVTMSVNMHLKYLFVANNPFEQGEIPTFISQLTNLKDLSLKGTRRTGTIPDWWHKLPTLTLLDLDDNNLEGEVPESFGQLRELNYLMLNNNQLTGNIPTAMRTLTNLSFLLMERNNLKGGADALCGNDKPPSTFIADCGHETGADEEFPCECCTECCQDDKPCNEFSWIGTVDPIWETRYERLFYQFEKVAKMQSDP